MIWIIPGKGLNTHKRKYIHKWMVKSLFDEIQIDLKAAGMGPDGLSGQFDLIRFKSAAFPTRAGQGKWRNGKVSANESRQRSAEAIPALISFDGAGRSLDREKDHRSDSILWLASCENGRRDWRGWNWKNASKSVMIVSFSDIRSLLATPHSPSYLNWIWIYSVWSFFLQEHDMENYQNHVQFNQIR